VIVCSEHTVVDRLCVRRRLGVLVRSLWQELVQQHICVLGLLLHTQLYSPLEKAAQLYAKKMKVKVT